MIVCKAATDPAGVMQVLQACLAGRQQPMRLMQAGMAFAVWTFQHSSSEAIQPHAPAMLERLLGLLDGAPGLQTRA